MATQLFFLIQSQPHWGFAVNGGLRAKTMCYYRVYVKDLTIVLAEDDKQIYR